MVPFSSSMGKHNWTEHCASTMGLRTTSLQAYLMVSRDWNSKRKNMHPHTHRTIPMMFQMSKEMYESNNIQDNNKEEED